MNTILHNCFVRVAWNIEYSSCIKFNFISPSDKIVNLKKNYKNFLKMYKKIVCGLVLISCFVSIQSFKFRKYHSIHNFSFLLFQKLKKVTIELVFSDFFKFQNMKKFIKFYRFRIQYFFFSIKYITVTKNWLESQVE